MVTTELHQVFLESASDVLETMFFTSVDEDPATGHGKPASTVAAALAFHGKPSGKFSVRVPEETGRAIAAGFLGLDAEEISTAQVGEVVCELTNMICGSVLSRLEANSRFELFHPELETGYSTWHDDSRTVEHSFGVEAGTLSLCMLLEQ